MSVLVDTNVLLRRIQPDHPDHQPASASVVQLLASSERLYFTHQNIAEFWNAATRPAANNGLGLSVAATLEEVEKIERALSLLDDTPAAYAEWRRLVIRHNVLGSKVHDARLVATMSVHGLRRILTFNTRDFARYDVDALHPATLLA